MSFQQRLLSGWKAFKNYNPADYLPPRERSESYSYNPQRSRLRSGNEQTIIASIYTRIAIDAASVKIRHVEIDEDGKYLKTIRDSLNDCFSISANIDQTGRHLFFDAVMRLLDEGVIALVPTLTDVSPIHNTNFQIGAIRVGTITQWYPKHVRVKVYDELTGQKKEIVMPKTSVAIVENPMYAVMNEHISTLKRLIHKMTLLDAADDKAHNNKLDLLFKVPWNTSHANRKEQAERRRTELIDQIQKDEYGIAYMGATESVVQLNRPIENQLLGQIEFYTKMLYTQLGMSQKVMEGTASEEETLNYFNTTVEPIVSAIVDSMIKAWLTRTAITQGHFIMAFRDPFKLVPMVKLAEITDSLTRNEVASSNDIRSVIGWTPSSNPRADELVNKNINQGDDKNEPIEPKKSEV